MATNPTHFFMNEDEPLHFEPTYLSSDEDSTLEYQMSRQCLPANNDAPRQPLNQFLHYPGDPTDAAQVTISSYDIAMTQLPSTAASNPKLQPNDHTHSQTSTFYSPPSGHHPVEYRPVSPDLD